MRSPTQVGLVGIGAMGMPMARRLASVGYELSVVARRAEVAAEAKALGARVEASPSDLAAMCEVVIVCVYTDEQVVEVAFGPEGIVSSLNQGAVLINHTTGRPSTAVALAAATAERGAKFLDCALSGGPQDIEKGELTLLVGGEPEVLEQARVVLEAYASPILFVGAAGDGQKVKLLNNVTFGAHVALAVEVEAAARALGMDPALALLALTKCSANSFALSTSAAHGSAAGLVSSAGRFIAKDHQVCEEVAAELGANLEALFSVARKVAPSS